MPKLEDNWINKIDVWWEAQFLNPTEWLMIILAIFVVGWILWLEYKEIKDWMKRRHNG